MEPTFVRGANNPLIGCYIKHCLCLQHSHVAAVLQLCHCKAAWGTEHVDIIKEPLAML